MAIRVDIDKKMMEQILEAALASFNRAYNTSKRPEFKELYERDKAKVTLAMNTLQEIK